jgi:Reverse transcriptase (RNA-dependent DNA polymerase)
MPFRLINAPATFQAYINKILKSLLDITYVAYLNNIYIYSDSIEEYAKYVREILNRLKKAELYVKFFKCEFDKKEIIFLKYVIGVYRIRINDVKIRIILDWPILKNFKNI